MRSPSAARVALLTLALLAASLASIPAGGQVSNCTPPPSDQRWNIVASSVVCSGRTITVKGVLVQGGGSLTLTDGTILRIAADADPTPGGDNEGISLWGKGDRLIVEKGSTLASLYPDKRAYIDAASSTTIRITDSTIRDIFGIAFGESVTGEGVLEGTFERNNFINLGRGILTSRISPGGVTIRANFFEGGGFEVGTPAIWSMGRELIESNVFVGCFLAIELTDEGAQPTIRQNTMTDCAYGIVCGNSCPSTPQSIHDNDIFANYNAPCAQCPTGEASFPGDATNNWWGRSPPDASRLYQFDYDPWRAAPVHPERLPSVTIGSVPTSVAPNQAVSFSGSASPSTTFGFPIASLEWNFGDGAKATGPSTTHAYTSTGTYTVEFSAKDSKGLSRMAQATIQVVQAQANRAPTVSSVSISPGNPLAGQALAATVAATDPDGDALTTTYAWARNGQAQSDLTGNTVPSGRTAAGDDWQVTATAHDPHGAEASKSAAVHVASPSSSTSTSSSSSSSTSTSPSGSSSSTSSSSSSTAPNHAPAVSDAAATPNPATVGQSVALHLTASDVDGDALTTTWTLPNGATLTGSDTTTSFSASGTKTIQYRVTDGKTPITGSITVTIKEPANSPSGESSGSGAGSASDSGGSPDASGSGTDGSRNSGGSSSSTSGPSGTQGQGAEGSSGTGADNGAAGTSASTDGSDAGGADGANSPEPASEGVDHDEGQQTAQRADSLDVATSQDSHLKSRLEAKLSASNPRLWLPLAGVWLPALALFGFMLRRRRRAPFTANNP